MARFLSILLLGFLFDIPVPFELIEASAESYVGGQMESKSGMNIHLTLLAGKSSKRLIFNKIIVNRNELRIKIFDSHSEVITSFQKSDTIHIYATCFCDKSQLGSLKNIDADLVYSYRKKVRKEVVRLEVSDKEFRK
ncbi:MAG: hypothetical protein JXA77_13800 [Bacteroidales bacterium]|nr:hypothetical protein [Bacteroidales bacterium]MBN2819176.1 hypothetical protein [Bacteroidales bacterium]